MKKALVILLVLSMLLGMAVVAPLGVAAEDETKVGTVAADYKPEGTAVSSAAEFAAMDPAGKYYLSADITISETYTSVFTGTFDGNGHTVTVSAPMFLTVNGTVCNLIVEGSIRVEAGTTVDGNIVGAVANRACYGGDASFYNIANYASLLSFATGMAGIVGRGGNYQEDTYTLTIKNCANYAPITTDFASANKDSAGILGYFQGNHASGVMQLVIEDCVNYGTVNACGRPGGILGVTDSSATLRNCINNGDIQAIDNYCGGIAARLGDNYKTGANSLKNATGTTILVENCVNNGKVTYSGKKAAQVGGICGYLGISKATTFKNCTNNGEITGVFGGQSGNFGGLVGASDEMNNQNLVTMGGVLTFENCTNNANVTVPDGWAKNSMVGGIMGFALSHADTKFISCVNKGDITNRGVAGVSGLHCNTGGIIGNIKFRRSFVDCYNFGDITGATLMTTASSWTTGGIVGYVNYSTWALKSSEFTRCGNMGNVTGGGLQTGGLVGYHWGWGAQGIGANFTYCFNTGDVTGPNFVSGLLGYINSSCVSVKYCYVAGKITCTKDATPITTGAAVKQQVEYTFNEGGKDYYFYAPLAGNVTITGTTVTIDTVDAIASVSNGDTVANGKIYAFISGSDTYLFKANANGTVNISGTTVTIGTSTTAIYTGKINSLDIPVYDHRINSRALFWSNAEYSPVDFSINVIAEDCAGLDYVCGSGNVVQVLGMTTDAAPKYTAEQFKSGEVAVKLNTISGTDYYRQNLLNSIFVVDEYPTTDATHAKVIESAGSYTNVLFDMNPDGTPATGDATVYVVIALAVSSVALAALVISKKRKAGNN